MSDILATHKRLVAAGLSEEKSKTFLRLLTDAESGHFGTCCTIKNLVDEYQHTVAPC